MTGRERGFLLLTGSLGDPDRRPLTVAQFRELTKLARQMERPVQDKTLDRQDLLKIGCNAESADRIVKLLSAEEELDWYLQTGKRKHCEPITRLNNCYPPSLRKRLALEAPACIWAKGDLELLQTPMIALVGSRDLYSPNMAFAEEVGKQAALQGYTLVSGNARGADRIAQDSCLSHGGNVVSIVADRLDQQPSHDRVLYLSDEGFDLPFSSIRALSRNRLIHALSEKTFVAQCTFGKGGTWSGSVQNLRFGWSPVFCFDDGSDGTQELLQRGALPVQLQDLQDIACLKSDSIGLF